MDGQPHQSRFHNVAGRGTESQHEINVDTCIPATLLKHAKACKRNIHEVPRDANSLFSALADQLTDATFTGQSLRDDIEKFISDRGPSEQHESFLLSNPNSQYDTRPTIQDAADFLRHNIVLYRDDDNPPYLIQPNVDGPDPTSHVLHIGYINNKYYVSFRPHGYNQGFHNVAGRETESQHEINVDTCIPATLLKHAKACKRNIHEVPRDANSLFSALADQLTDATFTGQSLRDDIETFISDRGPSEHHESFLLSNPNRQHDTRPTIQDAADFLRHNIVLYRDDDNPPYLIQPNVDGPDPTFQVLHIGCINNKYYVSFRSHGYNQGQGPSVHGNTDSDEDRSDTDSENVNSYRVTDDKALINIGDNNQTTVVADAKGSTSVKLLSYGNNNHFTLNIIVHKKYNTYVERMIDSGSCVGDEGIHMKIEISGIGQEESDRAQNNVIEHRIKIQENINAKIRSHGVELSIIGLGCLLMCFRPKSWLNCRAFIMGLRLHSEKYLDIFRQLLTAFQHINDSNNLTMDVKISIGQLSEGTNLSDCKRWTELKDIGQARDMDKTTQPFEKKDVGKKETTTDPRSGRSVGKDDKLSLKVCVRPVGDKSSLSSTDLEKVAMRTVEQVLEFKEADVPYIPHTKTHDQMTTLHPVGGLDTLSPYYFRSHTVLGLDTLSPYYFGSRPVHRLGPLSDYHSRSSGYGDSDSDAASDAESDVNSGPPKDADSVPPDGLGPHSVRSTPSSLDADKELRSLLMKLKFADQRKFTPLQQLSIHDPDIDGALTLMKRNVFVISSGDKQLGTAFSLGPPACTLTAGHVIGGYAGKYLQIRNELRFLGTRPIGIISIADVGVLRLLGHIFPRSVRLGIDLGTESCTYIYVVGYVDGNMSLQGEKCPVLAPRDKDDCYIRFQSKLFHQSSSGSPCLVFKDGKFVVKGILLGREEGTNMPYELIAITFRCVWKRLGLP